MNKVSAMAILQSRLDQLEIARQAQMNAEHTQSLSDINWGNQIRSYVLHMLLTTWGERAAPESEASKIFSIFCNCYFIKLLEDCCFIKHSTIAELTPLQLDEKRLAIRDNSSRNRRCYSTDQL